ncbi:MAG: hypothetical protein ABI776_01380 [Nocardioidaceae bacterium]
MTAQRTQTQTQTPARGPARFRLPEERRERRSVPRMLGSTVALLVIVVGVPLVLLLLDAPPPVPHGLPGREDLTRPLTTDAILVVLRAVVWLVWLQFVACLLVETVSLVRGGGLPRPVPLSGPSQQLARALVGSVLVGGSLLASTGVGTAVAVPAPTAGDTVTSVVHHGASPATAQPGGDAQPAAELGSAPQSTPEATSAPHAGVPQGMKDVIGKRVYVVKPPTGHYHDNLWDIAERHLGNGRRWHEIFALNQRRLQPDGEELQLGRLIQPGWVLIMPNDATGLTRVERAPAPAVQDIGSVLGGLARPDHQDGSATAAPTSTEAAAAHSLLARDLVGAGVFGAALLGALARERRRRRGRQRTADAVEAEVALRVGADADRAARLDRALRSLAAACRTEQRALPAVFAVTVSDDAIDLLTAPPSTDAPSPWTPLDDGRVWRLARSAPGQDEPGPDELGPDELGQAPFPGLVCLGRDLAGEDLLIDLESVGGVLCVAGPEPMATEVVSALAVQLSTSPWSEDHRVRGYQLSEVLADLAGDRLLLVDDLDPMLTELERSAPARSAQEVLTGRLARRPGVRPEYAVLGSAPEGELAERLAALAGSGARGFGVVATGHVPGTRWELEVDETGTLRVPLLGREVEAVRLTASSARLVAELFEDARTEAPRPRDSRVSVPVPARAGDDGRWSAAPVRIGVLGAIETRTPGALDPTRVALATELATFLALQASPVHPSVLAASVWPRGVTPEVRDATIERVREWLGADAEGNHHLRSHDDGRLSLAGDVAVDWHAFCELALRARKVGLREERELLRRALHLVRGRFAEGPPPGRYSWLARTRLETQVEDVVVDAAHRLVELCILDRDPPGAAAAALGGLRMAPGSQLLWRDLIRAEYDGPGGSEAARAQTERMVELLARRDTAVAAETDALVEELVRTASSPGVAPGRVTGDATGS